MIAVITEFFKLLFQTFLRLINTIYDSLLWIAACVLSPIASINWLICSLIDFISAVLPSTPDNLKVAYLVSQAGSQIPGIGSDIIWDILESIAIIFSISVVIKIYKLLPFKAT